MKKRSRYSSKKMTIVELWRRDNGICAFCGHPVNIQDATRDHKRPKSKGGNNKRKNLQLMHRSCNQFKADKCMD